ncbi:TPA: major capsid protein [Clostridium perfringens]|nr:major capsid protein [Clostridium phage phiCp-D]
MNLQDFINSKNIALYMKELPQEQTVDKALFPATKQLGTTLEFAKGAKKKAVALRMSTFDVAAKSRALSAALNVEKREIPFFKESLPLKESDRRDLINAANSNNENLVKALAGQVFENYANLIEGANIVAKRMRCELIQKGEINITTDDGDIVVDYGVPSNHKEADASPKWNVASTDIVKDIKKYQKAITDDNYTKPTTLLMTEKTFADTIMINTAITNHLKSGANVKNIILNEQDYINFLKDRLGLSVVFLENTTFIPAEGEEAQPYYLDGYVTLISGNTLGRTVYGTTPEEWDKVYGSSKLDTDIYDLAIAITTMVKEDPVTIDTKVSQLVIPSFERADECFFAKVY